MATIAREEVALDRRAVHGRHSGLFLDIAQLVVDAVDFGQDRLCLLLALGRVDVGKADQSLLLGCPKTNEVIIIAHRRSLNPILRLALL